MKRDPTLVARVVEEVRQVLGIAPGERIVVYIPQFERPAHWPAPGTGPTRREEWWALHTMTKAALQEMGFGDWDGRLMLIPGEWYPKIPQGFVVECISGQLEEFIPGKTDDDIRFGCLAYGIPAVDGVVEKEAS